MASGQGSHWLIESPTMTSLSCSLWNLFICNVLSLTDVLYSLRNHNYVVANCSSTHTLSYFCHIPVFVDDVLQEVSCQVHHGDVHWSRCSGLEWLWTKTPHSHGGVLIAGAQQRRITTDVSRTQPGTLTPKHVGSNFYMFLHRL